MTPTFCTADQHWTDGPCAPGKQSLGRLQLTRRLNELDTILGDGEERQSRGWVGTQALEAERVHLTYLRDRVFRS